MAHVRTLVVQAEAKQSANYNSCGVSAMATVDLAEGDDPLANMVGYTELLRAHVDAQLAGWAPPGQTASPLANGTRREPVPSTGRMVYDKD